MTIAPLVLEPDAPLVAPRPAAPSGFAALVATATRALNAADGAERAFAAGAGGIAEMTLARAKADILVAVTAAGTSRAAQALSTLLGMSV